MFMFLEKRKLDERNRAHDTQLLTSHQAIEMSALVLSEITGYVLH